MNDELQHEKVVPPALPPAYSQIPFYLTDLTDTPVIVKMIRVRHLKFSLNFTEQNRICKAKST